MADLKLTTAPQIRLTNAAAQSTEAVRKQEHDQDIQTRVSFSGLEARFDQNEHPPASGLDTNSIDMGVDVNQNVSANVRLPAEVQVQSPVSGSISVHLHTVEALDILSTGKLNISVTSVVRRVTVGEAIQDTGVVDVDYILDAENGTVKIRSGSNLVTTSGEEVAITFDAPQILDGPGLEISGSGLQSKWGTTRETVARGDHSHPKLHPKAFPLDTDSIDMTIDPDTQQVSAVVRKASGGGLFVDEQGMAVDGSVERSGHTHSGVTSLAAGFMLPEHLATLTTLSGLPPAAVHVNTDSIELKYDPVSGQVSGVLRPTTGINVTPAGVGIDFAEVAAASHVHARVTSVAAGFMHPDDLATQSGLGVRVTDLEAQDVLHGSGITKAQATADENTTRIDAADVSIANNASGIATKASIAALAQKADIVHTHVKADITDADFACLEATVSEYQESLRLMPKHLRVEMPKLGVQQTVNTTKAEAKLTGIPGRTYTLKVRVRGAVETKNHENGVQRAESQYLYEDGDILSSPWNAYKLEVLTNGSVVKTFYPNHDSDLAVIYPDYEFEFAVDGGSLLRLTADSDDDLQLEPAIEVSALRPGNLSGVGAYLGQFLEIEPVSVKDCALEVDRHDITLLPELARLRDGLRLTRIQGGGADAPVRVIEVIGTDIWIGGDFDHVAGMKTPGLVRLRVSNLEELKPDPTFDPGDGFTEGVEMIDHLPVSGLGFPSGKVVVGTRARSYVAEDGDASGGRQAHIIDARGVHVASFNSPLYIPSTGGSVSGRGRSDELIDVAGLSDGNIALLTPRTLTICAPTGAVLRRINSTERFNHVLGVDLGDQMLVTSHTYSGVVPVVYNEPGGAVNPKGAKLVDVTGLNIDDDWQNSINAGTGAGSTCGDPIQSTDSAGDYFLIPNGLLNYDSVDTAWNREQIGNLLMFSEELDRETYSGLDVWQRIGPNTNVAADVVAAPDLTVTADRISDDDGVDQAYVFQEVTIANDNTRYEFSVHVAKDAISSRFPIVQMKFTGGTTEIDAFGYLNTVTGAFVAGGANSPFVEVTDAAGYWRMFVQASNNSTGNTTLTVSIHPSYTDTWEGAAASIQGSGVFWGAGLTNASWQRDYIKTEEDVAMPSSGVNNSALFEGIYKVRKTGRADSNWDVTMTLSEVGHTRVFGVDVEKRIYCGGPVATIDGNSVTPWRLYRINENGTFDREYLGFNGRVLTARVTPCGRIIVGGEFTEYLNQPVGFMVLINPDGTVATDDTIIYSETEPDVVVRPDWRSSIWIQKSVCPIVPKIWDCDENAWVALGAAGLPTLPCPVFNPAAPGAAETTGVTLSVPGFTSPVPAMWWTDDDSMPTDASNLYSGVPIPLTAQITTLKAFGRLQGYKDSAVCSGTFLITPQLPCPTFVPGNGAAPPVSVALSVRGHSDASIYYTTASGLANPVDPTTGDTLYVEGNPIAVNHTMCIEAIAVKTGFKNSGVCEACYSPPVYGQDLPNVVFTPAAGLQCLPVDVALSVPGHPDASIYYTLDGSAPTFASSQYSAPVSVDEGETIKAFGSKLGWNPSAITSTSFTRDTVETPVISPSGGVVPQTVSMTCPTAGATIRYTVDGTTPTEFSTIYTTPFTVAAASTVKAKAYMDGCNTSEVDSDSYTSGPQSIVPKTQWKKDGTRAGQVTFALDPDMRFGTAYDTGEMLAITSGNKKAESRHSMNLIDLSTKGLPLSNSRAPQDNATVVLHDWAVDQTGDLIFVKTYESSRRAAGDSIKWWVSDDGGETWNTFYSGLEDRAFVMAGPNNIWLRYAGAHTVYRIDRENIGSGEAPLTQIAGPFTVPTGVTPAVGGDDVVAYVSLGSPRILNVSRDYGATWLSMNPKFSYESPQPLRTNRPVISQDGSLIFIDIFSSAGPYISQGGTVVQLCLDCAPAETTILSWNQSVSIPVSSYTSSLVPHFDRLGRFMTTNLSPGAGTSGFSWIPPASPSGTTFGIPGASQGGIIGNPLSPQYSLDPVLPAVFFTGANQHGGLSALKFLGSSDVIHPSLFPWLRPRHSGNHSMNIDGSRFVVVTGGAGGAGAPLTLAVFDETWNIRAKFDGSTPIVTDHKCRPMRISAAHVQRPDYTTLPWTPVAPMFTSSIPNLTANSDQSYVASASSEDGADLAFQAFDGSDSTKWLATGANAWIQIQLAAAKAFGALKIGFEAGDMGAVDIAAIVVKGSYDGATFDTIKTTPTLQWTNQVVKFIDLNNSCEFLYYRIELTSTGATEVKTLEFSEHPVPQVRAISFSPGKDPSAAHSRDFNHKVPSTPAFSPASGSTIPSQTTLAITSDVRSRIFYTLDGSTPDCSDSLYTAPFSIVATWTIKAIADGGARGFSKSAVGTATYSQSQVAPPVASPLASAIEEGSSVALTCATAGAFIYYTTDGTTPDATDTLYSTPVVLGALPTTIKAIAIKGGYTSSAIMSEAYTKAVAATPVADPTAGAVGLNSTVAITSTTPSASIYYTLNGVDPTTGDTLYSGAVTLTGLPVTLKAIAVKTGFTDSAVMSDAYTQAQVAVVVFNPAASPIPFPDNGGTEASIAMTCATAGAIIKYTTNGSAPSGGTTYSGPVVITAGTRVRAEASNTGFTTSAETDVTFARSQLAAPTYTPAGGVGVFQVALTHGVGGVSIYYTLDGSDPSDAGNPSRLLYSTQIAVEPPVTIKAVATKAGYTDSTIGSEVYT